jgi:L-gulonolactone oxidase
MTAVCSLLALSLGIACVAWWLTAGHRPASYDSPPVTNADGSVYFDHSSLVMPSSVEEVIGVVLSANRDRRKIKVLGAGHSRSEIAHSSDIYLSLYNYRGVIHVDKRKREVAVRAGTLLRDFNSELRKNGLSLGNLPTLGDQTMGGALAVGSHGTGLKYGNLATFVTSLSFVSGTGKLISVNATTDKKLFNAALASLGMIGIMTEVTLKCEESFNLRENITVLPLDECLRSLPLLSAQSDHGKLWLESHSGVCAVFNVWHTTRPRSPEQGVELWDIKNRVSEPLLWLGSWLPHINPRIVSFLYNSLKIFTPYERVDVSEDVFIPPLYVPANHQVEFAVDMKDCVAALRDWNTLASSNRHTNMFTEVRYVKKDGFFLSPDFERDSCHITIIIYNPSHEVLHSYFDSLCKAFSNYSARVHWAKHLCGLNRRELENLFPRLSDFDKIRSKMDPGGVFVNSILGKMFGYEACSEDHCNC